MSTQRVRGLRGAERGSGTVLTAGIAFALMAVAVGAWIVVAWLGQAARAQDAADLAALAGAGALAQALDPCPAAVTAAQRNEATLVGCEVKGDSRAFVVEVRVRVALTPTLPAGPREVVRRAAAGTS